MQTVRFPGLPSTVNPSRGVMLKLSPSRDVGALMEKMGKCQGKAKRSAIRADLRRYPVFFPGLTSTAEYIARYEQLNSGGMDQVTRKVSGAKMVDDFFDHDTLNDKPCTLYSGEDLREIIADGADDAPILQTAQDAPQAIAPADPVPMVQPAPIDAPAADLVVVLADPAPTIESAALTVNDVLRRSFDRLPIWQLPNYCQIAIERADADSALRTTARVSELIDAYAKTYGQACADFERASALHICARRFWDFDAAAPVDPAPIVAPVKAMPYAGYDATRAAVYRAHCATVAAAVAAELMAPIVPGPRTPLAMDQPAQYLRQRRAPEFSAPAVRMLRQRIAAAVRAQRAAKRAAPVPAYAFPAATGGPVPTHSARPDNLTWQILAARPTAIYCTPVARIGVHEWCTVVYAHEQFAACTDHLWRRVDQNRGAFKRSSDWPTYDSDRTHSGLPVSIGKRVFDPSRAEIKAALAATQAGDLPDWANEETRKAAADGIASRARFEASMARATVIAAAKPAAPAPLPSDSQADPVPLPSKSSAAPLAMHDRPLAAQGLKSYRAQGRYGWIMIGATDDSDAMRQALRSSDAAHGLQVWDGARYVPCKPQASDSHARSPEADHQAARVEVKRRRELQATIRATIEARDVALTAKGVAHYSGMATDAATLADITRDCEQLARAGELGRFDYSAQGHPPAYYRPRPSVPIHAAQYRRQGPALRIPAGDPRVGIPARFAPAYMLQA